MDLSDIQYLKELLESSLYSQDWDVVQEAIEFLEEIMQDNSLNDCDEME